MILWRLQLFFVELLINLKKMIKNLISPIQAWLLSQGRCVGCGEEISKGKKETIRGQIVATCRCGRVFIKDSKSSSYRRALFDDLE